VRQAHAWLLLAQRGYTSLLQQPSESSRLPRPYIADALRRKVMEDVQYRCGYCLTFQRMTAMPVHIDHLIPLATGGTSDEANLIPLGEPLTCSIFAPKIIRMPSINEGE